MSPTDGEILNPEVCEVYVIMLKGNINRNLLYCSFNNVPYGILDLRLVVWCRGDEEEQRAEANGDPKNQLTLTAFVVFEHVCITMESPFTTEKLPFLIPDH